MGISSTKAIIALGSMTTMLVFYDDAITAARGLVEATRNTVASAELSQFDRRLLEHWNVHGKPPSNVRRYLAESFDSSATKDAGTDPWEAPYVLESTPGGYLLLSAGPDGVRGSGDDLFVRRLGREVESHLEWIEDPDELIRPMEELAARQAKLARARLDTAQADTAGSGDDEDADEVERSIQAAFEELERTRSSGFVPSDDAAANGNE